MSSINEVRLLGEIAAAPKVRHFSDNYSAVELLVRTEREVRNMASGVSERQEAQHRVCVFSQSLVEMAQSLAVGEIVHVQGELGYATRDGENVAEIQIAAGVGTLSRMDFSRSRSVESTAQGTAPAEAGSPAPKQPATAPQPSKPEPANQAKSDVTQNKSDNGFSAFGGFGDAASPAPRPAKETGAAQRKPEPEKRAAASESSNQTTNKETSPPARKGGLRAAAAQHANRTEQDRSAPEPEMTSDAGYSNRKPEDDLEGPSETDYQIPF